MIEIVPISSTIIDWKIFLQVAKQSIGRSVTAGLDSIGQPIGDVSSYIVALGEFDCEDSNPTTTLKEAGALLRHVSLGFLVLNTYDSFLLEIATTSDIKILKQERCAVITGNLEEWRNAIINGCDERVSYDTRLFYDKCLLYFDRVGLGHIWSKFQKEKIPDGTFRLVGK